LPSHAGLIERHIALAAALMEAQPADPASLAGIPNGATAILISDDGPELACFNRALGRQALEDGQNVSFRPVRSRALLSACCPTPGRTAREAPALCASARSI
jgi:hypothetical protein